ncbi:MAG: chloride channel protein, partial [Anaerolineae bacterium]|nr:chloride channel protein [Anaerolineae bacterium]
TIGVFLPQVLGTGEEFMLQILDGEATFTIGFVLLVGVVKVIATAISSSGGFVGGVFAPVLFIGIAFGNAYGLILQTLLPAQALGNPAAYAIAGMAGALGGVVRAPIMAILLVFELTDDYRMILPIMLTTVICTMLVERMGLAGIYTEALLKNGVHLRQGRDIDLMQGIEVREAMVTPAPTITEKAPLSELRQTFREQHTRALCVVNGGTTLKGIVTLGDLQRAYEQANDANPVGELTVGDIATKDVVTVGPDDPILLAIQRMGARDIGRLPVVDERTGELVGLLRRQSIMIAYNTAITRKLHDQHYAEQIRLNTLTGAHVAEYEVQNGSPVANQMLKDVKWPPDSIVASVLRRGKLIVPRGSTLLHPHDKVTIVADTQCDPLLQKLFERQQKPHALD